MDKDLLRHTLIEWNSTGYGDYEYAKAYKCTDHLDAVKMFLDEYRDVKEFAVWTVGDRDAHDRLPEMISK